MAQATPSTATRVWQPSLWRYWARRTVRRWDLTPAQLTAVYLAFGFAALYFSDILLVRLVEDPARLSQLQAAKGGLEVLVTAGLILVLVRRSRRSLQRQNDRLERTREELQVLHRVIRHNLRNDINVVDGYGRQLQPAVDDPRFEDWCGEILEAAERIVRYTEQARKINQVDDDGPLTTVDLSVAAAEAVDRHRSGSSGAVIEFTAPETSPVSVHPMFGEALEEILANATEHADPDDPQVSVVVDPDAGPAHETALVVTDNGPGIPESVRDAVLGGGETPLEHLDGLGLWFVSWVVRVSDGRLDLKAVEPTGTRVTLRLPRAAADSGFLSCVSEPLGGAR